MAKLTRVTAIPFGLTGPTDDFETFGSTAAGGSDFSKDPAAIQATDDWQTGWRPALITAKAPVLQDLNGFCLVDSRQIAYMLQEGTPEYDSATVYYTGSLVKRTGSSEIYMSLGDSNTGNALPTAGTSDAHWQFVYGIIGGKFSIGAGLIAPDGTLAAPGIAFSSEPGTGLFRNGTHTLEVVVNGNPVLIAADNSSTTLLLAGVGIAEAVSGSFRPAADNTVACGSSPRRWTSVWAVNGTIQTSMGRTKADIKELKPEECKVPKAIVFRRPTDPAGHTHLGFLADGLPDEAHPVVDHETGQRDKDSVYTSSVIAMLCQAARNDHQRIKDLESRLVALEGKN